MEEKVTEVQTLEDQNPEMPLLFQRLKRMICAICGDQAFGNHYGVLSCKACRGFFRRAVSRQQKFPCVNLDWKCPVTLQTRNVCRGCRMRKCLRKGMQFFDNCNTQQATNLKPKKIIQPIDGSVVLRSTQTLSIDNLLENFLASANYVDSVIDIPEVDGNTFLYDDITARRGYHNAMQAQILFMVEWAKRIPGFRDLILDDQIALLRPAIRRSMFIQNAVETSRSPEEFEQRVTVFHKKLKAPIEFEVVDDFAKQANVPADFSHLFTISFHTLITPMMEFAITDAEFMCFLALVLLDPTVKGLVDNAKVRNLRRQVQATILQEKVVNKTLPSRILDLHRFLKDMDYLSYQEMVILRDSNYFGPLGKHAKLLDDLYFSS